MQQSGGTWYPAASVILGIGQGHVTATPLQAARWMGALATGSLATPRLGLDFAAADHAIEFIGTARMASSESEAM
ncbi:hypothetical protein D3C83_223640 [compost metagenome]